MMWKLLYSPSSILDFMMFSCYLIFHLLCYKYMWAEQFVSTIKCLFISLRIDFCSNCYCLTYSSSTWRGGWYFSQPRFTLPRWLSSSERSQYSFRSLSVINIIIFSLASNYWICFHSSFLLWESLFIELFFSKYWELRECFLSYLNEDHFAKQEENWKRCPR